MRILPLVLIASSLAAPASAATRNFGVSGFEKIRVDGPFKVRLTTGVAPFAQASGPDRAIDNIALDVQGSTLVVHINRSSWGGYPGASTGPVEISVGTHDLSAAWLNGAGNLEINQVKALKFDLSVAGSGGVTIGQADVDQLRVNILGNANAALGGRAGTLTAIVGGLSSLDASALSARDASIGAEGAATVKAQVANEATIDSTGTATVSLSGNPSCTVRAIGSATVSGCKSSQ
jgi:hypothetical protein